MELFTFIFMGGSRERIAVRELFEGARSKLATFDAAKARCFLPRDRQRMLAVIESAFGDLRPFNQVVRGILRERRSSFSKQGVEAVDASKRGDRVAPHRFQDGAEGGE